MRADGPVPAMSSMSAVADEWPLLGPVRSGRRTRVRGGSSWARRRELHHRHHCRHRRLHCCRPLKLPPPSAAAAASARVPHPVHQPPPAAAAARAARWLWCVTTAATWPETRQHTRMLLHRLHNQQTHYRSHSSIWLLRKREGVWRKLAPYWPVLAALASAPCRATNARLVGSARNHRTASPWSWTTPLPFP